MEKRGVFGFVDACNVYFGSICGVKMAERNCRDYKYKDAVRGMAGTRRKLVSKHFETTLGHRSSYNQRPTLFRRICGEGSSVLVLASAEKKHLSP